MSVCARVCLALLFAVSAHAKDSVLRLEPGARLRFLEDSQATVECGLREHPPLCSIQRKLSADGSKATYEIVKVLDARGTGISTEVIHSTADFAFAKKELRELQNLAVCHWPISQPCVIVEKISPDGRVTWHELMTLGLVGKKKFTIHVFSHRIFETVLKEREELRELGLCGRVK